MHILLSYIAAAVAFVVLDMLWLGLVAKNFYHQKLGHLMASNYVWGAVVAFYLIYIAGIMYFAVVPAMKEEMWQKALLNGALIGALCYATYDFTNWATLKDWPWQVTMADVAWGAFITAAVSVVGYFAGMAVK